MRRRMQTGGKLGFSGRLVAAKKKGPKEADRDLRATDAGTARERAVRESMDTPDSPTTGFRVADSQVPYKSGADLDSTGRIAVHLEGRPSPGEEGSEFAVSRLLERLNISGTAWREVERASSDARTERGIDFVARDEAGGSMALQVTRAERGLWKLLHERGVARSSLSVEEVVAALWAAIESKRLSADPRVVLLVDAVNVPQFVFKPAIDRFRETHGVLASQQGFAEVWLAGPTTDLTFRLDA